MYYRNVKGPELLILLRFESTLPP